MNSVTGFGNIVRVLRHPNFGIYAAGNVVSLIGIWMQRIATGWLTWQLTQSGAWLGLVAFADLFPTVLLGPLAGTLADRWDRLRVTRSTMALVALIALALFALTATGTITAPRLLALAALLGVVAAFNQPARLALTPALVPESDLTSAVAIISVAFNLARFLGPAAAGLIIATAGIPAAYLAAACTFAIFLVALSRIRIAPTAAPQAGRQGLFSEAAAGLRYTTSHAGIAAVLGLMLASNIGARPLIELLPGFTADVFKAGASGLAVLTSSAGLGAIIAGIWLSSRGDGSDLVHILTVSTLIVALSAALFVATDRLWAGAAVLVMTGFGMASAGIAAQTLIQISVEGSMRGRVLGIYALLFRGGPAFGALIMGGVSEYVGLRLPVLVGAIGVFLVFLWAWLRRRQIAASLGQAQASIARQ
jgi:MFS family permease